MTVCAGRLFRAYSLFRFGEDSKFYILFERGSAGTMVLLLHIKLSWNIVAVWPRRSLEVFVRIRILFVFAVIALTSCGIRIPEFQSPQNNQTVRIPTNNGSGTVQILLSANDLTDSSVQIEVHMPSSLQGRYYCTAGGPYGSCNEINTNGGTQTTFRNCSCQTPCTDQIALTARRGSTERTVFLNVQDTGTICQQQ